MSDNSPLNNSEDCTDCPLIERRAFLRDAGATLAAGLLLGLGASQADAQSLPLRVIRALARSGDEHSYPLPAEDGASIDKEAEIILVRYQQKVYAFNLSCPHQHTALKWEAEANQFQCPKHHSRYTPDGTFVSGRATRGMDRFGLRRDGENIVIDVAKYYRQDQNKADWEGAVVSL